MSDNSKIEWTEATWNPCTGCTKISPGCMNCYAERMAIRLKNMGQEKYKSGFKLRIHNDAIALPLHWKDPKKIFVNSMSDLFHRDVPDSFIKKVFHTMNMAPWHQFQVLTKRPERVLELNKKLIWTPNIWIGATVENHDYVSRIAYIRRTSAAVKFLSLEPLLGPLSNLNLKGIDWVIVGGESGPHARPVKKEWILDIKNQCKKANVAFFFKQWGGFNKKANGSILDGRKYKEMPLFSTQIST